MHSLLGLHQHLELVHAQEGATVALLRAWLELHGELGAVQDNLCIAIAANGQDKDAAIGNVLATQNNFWKRAVHLELACGRISSKAPVVDG